MDVKGQFTQNKKKSFLTCRRVWFKSWGINGLGLAGLKGDCRASAEVCALLSVILIISVFLFHFEIRHRTFEVGEGGRDAPSRSGVTVISSRS